MGARRLPSVTVEVGEVTAVSAPEDVLRGLHDFAAGFFGEGEDLGDFLFGADVVREGDATEAAFGWMKIGRDIFGEFVERVEREARAGGLEKCDWISLFGFGGEAEVRRGRSVARGQNSLRQV